MAAESDTRIDEAESPSSGEDSAPEQPYYVRDEAMPFGGRDFVVHASSPDEAARRHAAERFGEKGTYPAKYLVTVSTAPTVIFCVEATTPRFVAVEVKSAPRKG